MFSAIFTLMFLTICDIIFYLSRYPLCCLQLAYAGLSIPAGWPLKSRVSFVSFSFSQLWFPMFLIFLCSIRVEKLIFILRADDIYN